MARLSAMARSERGQLEFIHENAADKESRISEEGVSVESSGAEFSIYCDSSVTKRQ